MIKQARSGGVGAEMGMASRIRARTHPGNRDIR